METRKGAGFGCGGAAVVALFAALACGPVCGNAWGHYANVSHAPIVEQAIARAEVHPTVLEILGTPVSVSTIVTRDSDLAYTAGGVSMSTEFWRPGVTRKRIRLLTTITGPKGAAFFDVSGTEHLDDGTWHDIRMEVNGMDLGDVKSFQVDLTKPDEPGTIVR